MKYVGTILEYRNGLIKVKSFLYDFTTSKNMCQVQAMHSMVHKGQELRKGDTFLIDGRAIRRLINAQTAVPFSLKNIA